MRNRAGGIRKLTKPGSKRNKVFLHNLENAENAENIVEARLPRPGTARASPGKPSSVRTSRTHMRRALNQQPNRLILRLCKAGMPGIIGILFALTLLPRVVTAASSAGSSIPRSLPGAILLEGQAIPFLHGQPLVAIQVFVFRSNTLTPIPFQIDERDRRGRWVITAGPRPSHDNKPDIFDGLLTDPV